MESIGFLAEEKKRKIDFQDGDHGGHLGYPIGTIPSFESIGIWGLEKKLKIDFQDGRHGGHLGFMIGTILVIFDLHVTSMLPSKFGVNWPFGSGEEAKHSFSMAAILDFRSERF